MPQKPPRTPKPPKERVEKKTRTYAAAETLAGSRLQSPRAVPARYGYRGAMPAKPTRATKKAPGKAATPAGSRTIGSKLQELLEKTVTTLLLTATSEGDITFRADLKAEVLSDASVDVRLEGSALVITFYTTCDSSRRLLQGYERELRAHLEDRRLRVKSIRVLAAPDPDEPPPVPIA